MVMETLINFLETIPDPLLFFIGLAIRLLIGMRRFNRRGLGGLQHFNNYFVGLITLTVEFILKWVALVLMMWGSWGWIFR